MHKIHLHILSILWSLLDRINNFFSVFSYAPCVSLTAEKPPHIAKCRWEDLVKFSRRNILAFSSLISRFGLVATVATLNPCVPAAVHWDQVWMQLTALPGPGCHGSQEVQVQAAAAVWLSCGCLRGSVRRAQSHWENACFPPVPRVSGRSRGCFMERWTTLN